MLTYQEALDYLYSFIDHSLTIPVKYSSATFDLARMTDLLALLGNPQNRYLTVHLAGTKGKGSVSAMCANALRLAGYRTGFYTSPHLQDFCERMQVNGQRIAEDTVAQIVDRLRALEPQVPGITTFELTTALAFEFFAQAKVDVAVLEVGLGVRLDATNVITPLVSVITSLSYDHMNLLGNTLALIAGEKAGIIKPGVPVITAPQPDEAMQTLERIAAERGAPLTKVGHDWHYRALKHSLDSQTFAIWSAEEERQVHALEAKGFLSALSDAERGAKSEGGTWMPTTLEIPLLGLHQVQNASVAYATLMKLREVGLPISENAIRDGLRTVEWQGRFEILQRAPFVIADGAHNRDSAQKLAQTLNDYFPNKRVTLIFGASSDKDIAGMLEELLPSVQRLIMAQAVHPRAMDPDKLAQMVTTKPVAVVPLVAKAVEHALQSSAPDDVILATGSLFIVAETRKAIADLQISGQRITRI